MRWVVILTLLIWAASASQAGQGPWPKMREFELTVGIKLNNEQNYLNIPLYDENGDIRYHFICRGNARDDNNNPYMTWWPLTCILSPGEEKTDASLLEAGSYNTVSQTRGYFVGRDLVGACASYPEYGRTKHFRLRGFELTIEISDVVVRPRTVETEEIYTPSIDYMVAHISLRHDPSAQTAKAMPSGYLDPKGRCEVVKKGNERRMCRNPSTLSWEECTPGSEYEPLPWEVDPYSSASSEDVLVKRRQQVEKWGEAMRNPEYPESMAKETVDLVRKAAQEKNAEILLPLVPEPPFSLLCGKPGTPEWGSIQVDTLEMWKQLWAGMLENAAFAEMENLTLENPEISSHYGIWILGDTLRFQKGLTVATSLPCTTLKQSLEKED